MNVRSIAKLAASPHGRRSSLHVAPRNLKSEIRELISMLEIMRQAVANLFGAARTSPAFVEDSYVTELHPGGMVCRSPARRFAGTFVLRPLSRSFTIASRDPKSEANPKPEARIALAQPDAIRISDFGFFSDFGFRVSDLWRTGRGAVPRRRQIATAPR